jgi:hypothetical protein
MWSFFGRGDNMNNGQRKPAHRRLAGRPSRGRAGGRRSIDANDNSIHHKTKSLDSCSTA